MAETSDVNCAAPDWWPLGAQKAWAEDSYRLFAREGQDIMIEAALVNTAGWCLPFKIVSSFALKVSGTRAVRIRSEKKLIDYLCVR